jgi:phospholipid transport system substrate-binding protein
MHRMSTNYFPARQLIALLCATVLGLSVQLSAGAADAEDGSPVETVEKAAATLQNKLTGQQEYFAQNSAELFTLIDEVMLPSFDVQYAGKLVLGKTHWMAATEEQRQRFIDAFYGFLVRAYAKGILEFEQEKMIVYPGASYSKDGRKALVRTELVIVAGDNVQVNYSLRQTESGWKIYDVRIEGVSYIQNYRNQFDAEISAQGIEALIVRLEEEALDKDEELSETARPAQAT